MSNRQGHRCPKEDFFSLRKAVLQHTAISVRVYLYPLVTRLAVHVSSNARHAAIHLLALWESLRMFSGCG